MTAQNENHRRQINEGIAASLTRAGIPPKYHDQSVRNLPDGEDLADKVTGEFATHAKEGGVLAITGSGVSIRNTLIMIARGFHLQGIGCRVLPLSTLAWQLADPNGDDEAMDRLADIPCLAIHRFYVPQDEDDKQMTPRTRSLVEDFLMGRSDDGKAHIVHCNEMPPLNDPFKWWRPDFVRNFFEGARQWRVDR